MSLTYLYVIAKREGDALVSPVKVGITSDPTKRLYQIQNTCPFPAAILCCLACPTREAALAIERSFHEAEDAYNLHGEWFDMKPTQAAWAAVTDLANYWVNQKGYSHKDSGAFVDASLKMCEQFNGGLYA